jgi:hypothetical protein
MKTFKFNKVKSIIESCETYEQVQTCFSFVRNESFFPNLLDRYKVLGLIQAKAYSLRNEDIKFYKQELTNI